MKNVYRKYSTYCLTYAHIYKLTFHGILFKEDQLHIDYLPILYNQATKNFGNFYI